MNRFDTADDVNRWILSEILQRGEVVNPRGQTTKELLAVSFCLTNVRARVIENPARRFSMPLALGEFAWHIGASDEVDALAYYAPRWRDFSDDGVHVIGSCYGRKIFGTSEGGASPWNRVLQTLRLDPASRRAVLSLWDERLAPTGKDLPCTMTIQFLVRQDRLVAVVHMRSNDAIWGIPYDVFLFTMLQEYLATCLGVEVGDYIHLASSMHLYERHLELAERILSAPLVETSQMPRMTDPEQLAQFVECERLLREGADGGGCMELLQSPYWQRLLDPLLKYQDTQKGRLGMATSGVRQQVM
jgi:thymidylate synthase